MFQSSEFFLMNKDEKILKFKSEPDQYGTDHMETIEYYTDESFRPVGFNEILSWLENRRAPKHRQHIESLLRRCGCESVDGFIRVAHALTLNDTFWVREAGSDLTWNQVSLYINDFDELIAHTAFEGGMFGENFTTTSPEFGTDGAFAKCWIREEGEVFLLKRGSTGARNTGLEPYSEAYAAQIAKQLCRSYVNYDVVQYRGKVASKCKLFTSESEGFVPISRYVSRPDPVKLLEFFERCDSGDDFRRMLVLDALIVNTDRHLGNLGVIIDNDTMQTKRMAPVFDNNQALLPYAEKDEFEHLEKYLEGKGPRIGIDFCNVAQGMMTPAIKAELINLKDFTFARNGKFVLPEERVRLLEKLISHQTRQILNEKKIYLTQAQKKVPRKGSSGKKPKKIR